MTFRPFASAGFDPALIDRTSWTDFGLYCQGDGGTSYAACGGAGNRHPGTLVRQHVDKVFFGVDE